MTKEQRQREYDNRLYDYLMKKSETEKWAEVLLVKEFGEDGDRDFMIKGRDE